MGELLIVGLCVASGVVGAALTYALKSVERVEITYINPDWDSEEKYNKLLEIKQIQDNTISEYDSENRALKKKINNLKRK